jgi:predicted phosphodiesterase
MSHLELHDRFAVVSDIHGNLPALEAVCRELAREGVEQVINLGDSFSGPLWPAETASFLRDRGWPTLAGNHERYIHSGMGGSASDAFAARELGPEAIRDIARLPKSFRGRTRKGASVLFCHGVPDDDCLPWLHTGKPGDYAPATRAEIARHLTSDALALCGHTHLPRVHRVRDRRVVANPGSVGLPAWLEQRVREPPPPTFLLVEQSATLRVTMRSAPYRYEYAAQRAETNSRTEWAFRLRTGVFTPPMP